MSETAMMRRCRLLREEWFTCQLRGLGRADWKSSLSFAHVQRGFKALESMGALRLIAENLSHEEEFREVLTCPSVVTHLLMINDLHGERLWQDMLRRSIAKALP